jgi:DNA gyrase subunit A
MLDQGVPKILGLKDIIAKYVDYQKLVIIRRTKYDLARAEERKHILDGLKIALDNIDAIVHLIRAAKSDEEAITEMNKQFGLDEIQAKAILDMRLRRLTGLERDKVEDELREKIALIDNYRNLLSSEENILQVVKQEMIEIRDKYGDERRTKIDMTAIDFIEDESLIPNENSIITITDNGYIKRLLSDTYKVQNRGGVGIKGMSTNEEDNVKLMINVMTHDDVLFFTDKGKVYRIRGYEIPEFSRQAKGLPIINLLNIEKDEKISSIIKIERDNIKNVKYLFFATKKGIVKRTSIEEFENIRTNGKICITLKENDELIAVRNTDGNKKIILGATNGRAVLFDEEE